MVYRRLAPWSLALGVMIGFGTTPCEAVPIALTGFVEKDFDPTVGDPLKGGVRVEPVTSDTSTIGQSEWITDKGWVSGWNVKDIRFSYDSSKDVLYVGVNTWANPSGQYAPFGQANGDPSGAAQPYDPASLGSNDPTSDKSVALAFATYNKLDPTIPGNAVAIAGVPADKSLNGPGINGYTVSTIDTSRSAGGLGYMFGNPMSQHIGDLAFDPTPSHPQLEFSVANFSQLVDPKEGFWVAAYAGSGLDGVAGEANMGWRYIGPLAEQVIPEPATIMAWTLACGAIALRVRNRKRAKA